MEISFVKVDIAQKQQITIETFTNKANGGKSFTGIRFRVGKRSPKTVFHFHYSKAWEIIDALQSCLNGIPDDTESFYESPAWQRLRYETFIRHKPK